MGKHKWRKRNCDVAREAETRPGSYGGKKGEGEGVSIDGERN